RDSSRRPTVQQHYDSMQVTGDIYGPARITLVDDVVTIGRTFFGAALRLLETYPNTVIQCFSLVRALNYTSIQTLSEMQRPLVSRYWRDEAREGYFIRHERPH